MKGLLHSKRFRKNLRHWLFMYVGVMALLTTAITYSKYMAKMSVDDSARISKFNIDINPVTCPIKESSICNSTPVSNGTTTTTPCRPTQVIASCFEVDTTGLEVDSDLVLTFYPAQENGEYNITENSNSLKAVYKIVGIDRIENNSSKPKILYASDGKGMEEVDIWSTQSGANSLKLIRKVEEKDSVKKWTIRVRMVKDNENNNYSEAESSSKIVKVGYSMSQIITEKEGDKK